MIRKITCIFLLVILLASCGNDSSKNTGTLDDTAKINQAVDMIIRDMPVPGVLLYLFVPGRLNLVIAKGLSDIESQTPMSPGLVFRIGSISKTFTAVTVLQLADENKLSLDDKLSKYEPRIPNAEEITLRMILNHTCGIFSYTNDNDFVNAIKTDPLKKWTYEEIIDIALAHPAEFLPGQGFGYSNTAYFILGRIIEKVTGNKAEDEIKTRIIDRLGLENTSMADGVDIIGACSHGYTYDLGNGLQDITRQELGSWGWTAGGLLSTMADMAICAEAFSDGRLLSEAMNTEFMNWMPIPVAPGAPQESYTGLGIVRYKTFVGNSGGTYGYTSWMWHIPSKNATLVAFFNQTSTFTPDREVKEQELLADLLISIMDVIES